MRLVFFTNPWTSAKIRGDQIAARFEGSLVNPEQVQPGDICIFVKCLPNDAIIDTVDKCYLDIVDSMAALNYAYDTPIVSVIAIGKTAHEYISKKLNRSDIILIPEHHCNFERAVRDRDKITRVGFCGYAENFHLEFGDVSKALESIDVEFVYKTQFENRIDVCNFYQSIDIQLCFRKLPDEQVMLKNPLKLANAGSFKIPTLAYPEPSYLAEWNERFIRVENLDQIVQRVEILKESSAAYETSAERAFERAEKYHIDKVIPLYKALVV